MTDLLVDQDDDLMIVNGDLAIGDSSATDVNLLMYSFKGEWKQHPVTGVEAITYVKKRNGLDRLKKEARQQLSQNNFKNISIQKNGEELNVNADPIK